MRGNVVAPAQMLLGAFPPGMTLSEGHSVVSACCSQALASPVLPPTPRRLMKASALVSVRLATHTCRKQVSWAAGVTHLRLGLL